MYESIDDVHICSLNIKMLYLMIIIINIIIRVLFKSYKYMYATVSCATGLNAPFGWLLYPNWPF